MGFFIKRKLKYKTKKKKSSLVRVSGWWTREQEGKKLDQIFECSLRYIRRGGSISDY